MARIKIEDLKGEQNLDDMDLNRIKGGISPVPLLRFRSFVGALPDPMPSPDLVSVSPITLPRPIRGLTPEND